MIKALRRNDKTHSGLSRIDPVFVILVCALAVYGTLMVFSAGYAYADFRYKDAFYFVKKQTVWLLIGIVAMLIASKINPDFYKRITPLLYSVTLVLLLLVLIIGFAGNGAQRWISIGPLTVQPSEIAKLTLIMTLAYYFSVYEKIAIHDKNRKSVFVYGTLIPFSIMLVPILLVMLQKHLSCIIILGIIGMLMIVSAGVRLRYIGAFLGIGLIGVSYIAFFTDYTKQRITVWQNPELYRLTGGWQTLQGLMAIGSGGILGVGFGKSILKHCYVSEPANDMIFAILCEELGMLGAISVLLLFGLLIARGCKIAFSANSIYEQLLCIGICIKMATQVALNIAVVTNTIPNTGISLPFFSYGGSSLVMLFFEMGILLSVSRRARIAK